MYDFDFDFNWDDLMGLIAGTKYYRCGNCDLNYPRESEFSRCLKCRTPTAEMQAPAYNSSVILLTVAEIAQLKFEHYLATETDNMRNERRDKHAQRQREDAARLGRFDEVIIGAGFQDWERERIADLEAQLGQPPQRQHRAEA